MIPIAWILVYLFRFNFDIPAAYWTSILSTLPWLMIIQGISFWTFGLYRGIWRFSSLPDVIRIIKAVIIGTLVFSFLLLIIKHISYIPRSALPLYAIFLIGLLSGSRSAYRWLKDYAWFLRKGKRTLIIGAGNAGEMIVREMQKDEKQRFKPVAFVDDDPDKLGREILGIRVVNSTQSIAEVIKEEAIRCGVFYINRRWLGGLLTNFDTIRQRLNRLRELEEMQESGTLSHSNKKELSVFNKELEKLQKTLGGIKNMRGKPDIIYVIDGQREEIAVREAILTGVKVVAIIDTNCSPVGIDYPIPGNDDSIRSVKLITAHLRDAIIEGHEGQIPNVHKTTQIKENNTKKIDNNKQILQTVQEITVPQVMEISAHDI